MTIRVSTQKPFGVNLKPYFYDYDNDWLTFEMTSESQITELAKNDIYFYEQACMVGGSPERIAYHKMNKVVATDPHGFTTTLYFTVIVEEERYPVRRSEVPQLDD